MTQRKILCGDKRKRQKERPAGFGSFALWCICGPMAVAASYELVLRSDPLVVPVVENGSP